MTRNILLTLQFLFAATAGAAPFQNLDFEGARTNSLTPASVQVYPDQATGPVSDLLPGWQLLHDGQPVTTMDYNNLGTLFPLDTISLIGPAERILPHIEGRYLLSFDSRVSENYILSQRGDIPADAQQLFFQYQAGPFIASINGEAISPGLLPVGPPTTVYADVSRFAGQNVELSFRPLVRGTGAFELDNIGFTVPEPSTITLAFLATAVLG